MNTQPKSICLIDDDKIYQFTAKKIIEATGFAKEITPFLNGADAITYFKQLIAQNNLLPDIIFLDINMPLMDGWVFLDQFTLLSQTLTIKPKVFMVSSSIDDVDIAKAKQYACLTDYIIKPINKETFQKLICDY